MINLLIGPPGGGKSYEAVVYHILPALKKGRKVITNLPIKLDAFREIDPTYPDLIDLVVSSRVTTAKFVRPFSHIEDYGDLWRHPETGSGPLYVIDECHEAIPRLTASVEVMEWFAKHRHESADVLLVTQSYGKLHADIRDMVQLVYRVKKATAFGSATSYIRKVQDGLRGDTVNTSVRTYKKQFFPLYQSHTKGGGAELAAQDVTPIWKRWPVILFVVMAVLVVGYTVMADLQDPFQAKKPTGAALASGTAQKPAHGPIQRVSASPDAGAVAAARPDPRPEPFESLGLHLVGQLTFGKRPESVFIMLTDGGRPLTVLDLSELLAAGYEWHSYGTCAGVLSWHGKHRTVVCNAPSALPGTAAPPLPVPVL